MEKRGIKKKLACVVIVVLLIHTILGKVDGSNVWAGNNQGIENVTVSSGDVMVSSGDAMVSSGDATVSSGDAMVSSGDAMVSSGDATVSSGDATDTTSPEVVITCDSLIANEGMCKVIVSDNNFDTCDIRIYVERKTASETEESVRTGKDEKLENGVEKQLTFAEEGHYSVYVEAIDKAGNSTKTAKIEFTVDTTAPVLVMQGVSDGYMTKDDVEFSLKVAELYPNIASYELLVVRSDIDGELERFCIQGEEKTEYDIEEGWTTQQQDMSGLSIWSMTRKLCFQKEGIYQLTFRGRDIAGNEGVEQQVSFYIDRTAPVVSNVIYSNENGSVVEKYNQVLSSQAVRVEFQVRDQVTGVKAEEVYIQLKENATSDEQLCVAHKGLGDSYYVEIPTDLGVTSIKDKLLIQVRDYVENENRHETKQIAVNAAQPVIQMDCVQDYTKWTNQNVTFHTTITDENIGLKEVEYKVAGITVHKITFDEMTHTYSYDVVVSKEAEKVSGHTVIVEVTNNAGIKNTMKRQTYIDKTSPKVSLSGVANGAHYNSSQTIKTLVQDVSYKGTDTIYYITCNTDGKSETSSVVMFSASKYEDEYSFEVSKEGEYKIYAITTDAAGNQKKSNTLSFVIDKTAPKIYLDGIQDGQVVNYGAEVSFTCEESFYKTCNVDIEVERTLDGKKTKMEKGVFSMRKKSVTENRMFEKDGSYTVRIAARDKAGNVAQAKEVTFIVDCTAPVIRITGTENYQMWSKEVVLQMMVEESYYKDNRVIITGTRKDIEGKVEAIATPFWRNRGKISEMQKTFEEDGIYELQITAKDAAGNQQVKRIHFTIDKTKPEIHSILQYNGGYYQSFQMTNSLADIFKDLTVVSYHILLNGVEYNGTDLVEMEGKYNLYVEVEDELGHRNHESVEFAIDRTAPRVIFQGIATTGVVTESGEVTWKLDNTEDRITGVRINNKQYDVKTMSFPFEEYGSYRIEVDCEDKAGNAITRELQFVYNAPQTESSMIAKIMGILAFVGVCFWFYRGGKEWKKR